MCIKNGERELKQALRKSKPLLYIMVGALLLGLSFFFSACIPDNTSSVPSSPIGVGGHGGSGPPPAGSTANYVVGSVGYTIDSTSGTPVTTYLLAAAVAGNSNPVTSAAVTFTDPNGTNQYSLAYSGTNQSVGGVTCGMYQDIPASFTTVGVFNLKVVTPYGTSAASVTAINSVVTFSTPYTAISWTGSSQQNALAVISVATPSTSYSQASATSPINIPASTYTSGVAYDYSFVQVNEATTINGGTGSAGYLQISNGTFVAP